MAKTIKLTFEDKEYTLEFTRKTLEKMEADGIYIAELQNKVVTTTVNLFRYSFFANHKRMKNEEIERVYNKISKKQELIAKLTEMVMDTLNSLYEEPEEKNAITWTATF